MTPRRILLVAGQYHAPFTGDDVLRHIEAETAEVAEYFPGLVTTVLSFDGMGAIFDQFETCGFSTMAQMASISQGRPAKDRQNRPSARGDLRLDSSRVNIMVCGSTSTRTGVAPAWMMVFRPWRRRSRRW